MFKEILNRIRQTTNEKEEVKLKENDLDILQVLHRQGKQIKYRIGKQLKKQRCSMPKTTLSNKLERLSKYGVVNTLKETDGLTYYELTPFGLVALIAEGRVRFNQALTYFEDHQKEYFETLARLQPNLKEQLRKNPAFIIDQVTDDLWVFHYLGNRLDLRLEVIDWALHGKKMGRELQFQTIPFCINRIKVEEKTICLKQRKTCPFTLSEIPLKCSIIREQMEKEFKSLIRMQES